MLADASLSPLETPHALPTVSKPCNDTLRVKAVQRARERNRLAHMVQAADPRYRTLNPHTETGMRYPAKFPQIEIPLERLLRQIVLVNPRQQLLVRSHALRAADDLAISLGREHVHAERDLRIVRVRLHVERLHLDGITMDHHRSIELRRDVRFVGRSKIAAPLKAVLQLTPRMSV